MKTKYLLLLIIPLIASSCSTALKTTYRDGGFIDDTYHIPSNDDELLALERQAPEVVLQEEPLNMVPYDQIDNAPPPQTQRDPLPESYSRDFSYERHFNRLNPDSYDAYRDGYRDGFSDGSFQAPVRNNWSGAGWVTHGMILS